MPLYTVRVPMFSYAIFDEVEAESSEAAINLVKDRIEEQGIYDACDRVEDHAPLEDSKTLENLPAVTEIPEGEESN